MKGIYDPTREFSTRLPNVCGCGHGDDDRDEKSG